jgi:hypothetical protein
MAVAAFPSLKPSARTWTPGNYPVSTFNTLSGYESRVLLGSSAIGTSLSMTFSNLKESDLVQVTDHHLLAKGSYDSFSLPAAVFAGMSNYGKVTPSGFVWRYASAPVVDWVAPGIGNVSVDLLAIPN